MKMDKKNPIKRKTGSIERKREDDVYHFGLVERQ
jgi:hypothetical protein